MPSRSAGRSFVGLVERLEVIKPCLAQIWRRTAARVSEKVGCFLRYQAASETCVLAEAGGQQRDAGEQPEQAGCGTSYCFVRPLPLGLDTQVVAHLAEADLQLPTLDEPANDLQRLLGGVGAEPGLRVEALAGVAPQPLRRHSARHARGTLGGSAQRIGTTGKPAWRQTAVSEQISTTRSPSPYQPGTVTRCQRVVLSAKTSIRLGVGAR